MVEFSVSKATRHSPFESLYGFQPSAPVDRMMSLDDIPVSAADRLQNIADTQMVVRELLKLSKDRQSASSTTSFPEFAVNDLVYLSTKGLRIKSQRCKKLMDRRLGPFKVLERIGRRSYRLQLHRGSRLHPVFHVDVLSPASTSTPLRPHIVDAVDDEVEYEVARITDVKLDSWPRRRGRYVLFLTHYVGYDRPEWSLYSLLDDTAALDDFLKSDRWAMFAASEEYRKFCADFPRRIVHV